MECTTIKGYNGNVPIMGPKVKFASLAKANLKLAKINKDPKNHIKRVVYQCSECGFYHIGKTLEMLNREAPKRKRFLLTGMKVVGQVDLSQFNNVNLEEIAERKRLKKEMIQAKRNKAKANRNNKIDKSKEIREFRQAKIKKLKSTPSKFVGHFSTKYGLWMYFVKNKIVKVMTTEGSIKHVKLNNIFSDELIESFNLHGDPFPSSKILIYLKSKEDELYKRKG